MRFQHQAKRNVAHRHAQITDRVAECRSDQTYSGVQPNSRRDRAIIYGRPYRAAAYDLALPSNVDCDTDLLRR
jgi:hypothetical protein